MVLTSCWMPVTSIFKMLIEANADVRHLKPPQFTSVRAAFPTVRSGVLYAIDCFASTVRQVCHLI